MIYFRYRELHFNLSFLSIEYQPGREICEKCQRAVRLQPELRTNLISYSQLYCHWIWILGRVERQITLLSLQESIVALCKAAFYIKT